MKTRTMLVFAATDSASAIQADMAPDLGSTDIVRLRQDDNSVWINRDDIEEFCRKLIAWVAGEPRE